MRRSDFSKQRLVIEYRSTGYFIVQTSPYSDLNPLPSPRDFIVIEVMGLLRYTTAVLYLTSPFPSRKRDKATRGLIDGLADWLVGRRTKWTYPRHEHNMI